MVLRNVLILGMVTLAVGVWVKTWSDVQAKSRAEREWCRVAGEVFGLADPLRPDVRLEQGIEFIPAPSDGYYSPSSNERILEMETDEGLRRFHRYEFLIDPITKRARVARVRFSPFVLALLGLVYLGLAGALYYLSSSRIAGHEGILQASMPGAWSYFQDPPWHEPAVVSARSTVWPAVKWGLGAAIGVLGFVMLWTARAQTLWGRVGISSVALFMAIVFSVLTLNRATYRIEADSTGVRESSAVGWKMTPWPMLRDAVDETVHYAGRLHTRQPMTLSRATHRVYFTDDQGEEVVCIDDDMVPEQSQALVAHILDRTGLKLKKRKTEEK
jgi:hypothetical protein